MAADQQPASDMTVADKIRTLAADGVPRAEIARRLGKRYQHVRNVLEGDRLMREAPAATGVAEMGVAEQGRRFRGSPREQDVQESGPGLYRLAVGADGSVVLPAAVREAYGIRGPSALVARLAGDEFTLVSATTLLNARTETSESV